MNIMKPELLVSENMSKPKKIIHFIQSLSNGGCENMLLRALPLLEKNNFENIVITLQKEGVLAEDFRVKGIKIENIGQKNLLDVLSYFKLVAALKRHQPDIIVTYLFRADLVGRFLLKPFYHENVISFLRTTYNHFRYWPAKIFEITTKRLAKHYLANSRAVKDYYVVYFGVAADKITVIPNGIDIDYYKSITRNNSLRKIIGAKENDIVLICVANLLFYKGHRYLLEAFETVYQKKKNIRLFLVGDGKEKGNLLKQIDNYASRYNIHLLGRRSDVPQLLKISDIFVFPTLFEGMSNAIMEAMASGKAVIATDISENKELIINGETGILVPIKNAGKIAEAIERLIDNPFLKNDLEIRAQAKISSEFSIDAVVQKLSRFFNGS